MKLKPRVLPCLIPVRATYVNLYKWPESIAEFVKYVEAIDVHGGSRLRSRVVVSISCRQMYLMSYTFFRTETMPDRAKKCFRRVKQRMTAGKEKKRVPAMEAAAASSPAKNYCRPEYQNTRTAKIHLLFERL
ncbi:uncharacterized protein Fot_20433 [Forsythia ovata]|uniref:Uncharacterized protein n=1 Tax=Forsythia ovata TaxID=205694 RepID=A0ABD1URZ7_9LAMI